MCRRELTKSTGAIPAWAAVSAGSALRASRPAEKSRKPKDTRDLLVRAVHHAKLDPLPGGLARKVQSVLQKEAHDRQGNSWQAIFAIVDALLVEASGAPHGAPAAEAAQEAKGIISQLVALRIGRMRLVEVANLAPRLADMLGKSALLEADVLPEVGAVMQREIEQILQVDSEVAFTQMLEHFQVFRDRSAFQQLEDSMRSSLSQKVVEMVQQARLEQLPEALTRSRELLQPWPEACQEVTAALRCTIPERLLRIATRWAEEGGGGRGPSLPVSWWVEVLSAAVEGGLLDRAGTREVCDLLAPGLAREGVRTEATASWSVESRQFVVARQLGRELFDRPREVQYRPKTQLLLFHCTAGLLPSEPASPGSPGGSPMGSSSSSTWGLERSGNADGLLGRRLLRRETVTLGPLQRPLARRSASAAELGSNASNSPAFRSTLPSDFRGSTRSSTAASFGGSPSSPTTPVSPWPRS